VNKCLTDAPLKSIEFLVAKRFLAFYRRQVAFSGISEASGHAPAARYFGALFFTVRKEFSNIFGGGVDP